MSRLIGAAAMSFVTTVLTPNASAQDADVAAIETIVESVGTLADRGNFMDLEALYAPEVRVDYSSLSGQTAELKSPRGLMTEWAATLPGFDRTRHELSAVEAKVRGKQGSATADVVASHWLGEQFWQVEGRYAYEFENDDGNWLITSMTFVLEEETGSREIFGPAMEAAAANPPAIIVRQQTRDAVRTFLSGLEEKDMEKVNGVWAEDAVQHMPFSPEGFPKRVSGREGLMAHYAGWPENARNADFTSHLVFYDTLDPEVVFAEWRGNADIVPTGRTYRQTYGGLFHVEDGKIALFREYYDPAAFAYAFGLDGDRGSFRGEE
ncbi:nuclear transport factor 2 family protein [Parvularcula maris]|uniref:Nuclear transport factor 2 family protein n=1 Tax=Parvularcula maris TaxID=2965077 RepID=A0A9X2LBD1_9PROT|nr:nuclear transport factor 2 family protein [Parvularcula maris]MCQ8186619.1 nuclear transport factor 2 family protein [Parvularcula maris]